jgi:hypothetical protein
MRYCERGAMCGESQFLLRELTDLLLAMFSPNECVQFMEASDRVWPGCCERRRTKMYTVTEPTARYPRQHSEDSP